MDTVSELIATTGRQLDEARTAFDDSSFDRAAMLATNVISQLEPIVQAAPHTLTMDKASPMYSIVKNLTNAYRRLCVIELNNGDVQKSIQHAEKALSMVTQLHDDVSEMGILSDLGAAHLSASEYTTALEFLRNAETISTRLGDARQNAWVYGRMGVAYKELSDYPSALTFFQKSLDIYTTLDNKDGVATYTLNTGIVHQALSNHSRALELFRGALAMFEELGDTSAMAFALSTIGGLHFRLHEYEHALDYYGRALTMQESARRKRDAVVSRGNIGHAYKSIGDFNKALEFLLQALQESIEIGAVYPQIHWLNGLGDLYAEPAFAGYSPSLAESYLQQAVDLSQNHQIKSTELAAYDSLNQLYKSVGDWERAYQARDKYEILKEKINIEGAQRHADKIESERREAERMQQMALERTRFQERENILNNILPEEITIRLIAGENPIADTFDCVSILFMDIVEFTKLSTTISAQQLVHLLNAIFTAADGVMREFGLEKIKTIGDAYMAVAGAPVV
ncbi:MAG: tetratricopeptide repeat protein, partial [Candidatus Kapabacteria bacterium]|nr:tetratricopeptide repeat protein [Candidatus Kapabacteria bacterium]